MKRSVSILLSAMLSILLLVSVTGCGKQVENEGKEKTNQEQKSNEESKGTEEKINEEGKSIILATTTSTYDSGLLDYLLPKFTEETGIEVKVVPLGTGAAIELAQNGDADCLLVHAKAKEEAFIEAGYGLERFDVMYNDFVIVGPESDPAGLKEKAPSDPVEALKLIAESKATFISRGDDSGTHTKEKDLWAKASIEPSGDWYVSAGKGMGDVIQMAEEMEGYTLTDRATYLSMKDNLTLNVVTEKNDSLYNQYGVIRINPDKNEIKEEEANQFIDWILSDEAQKLIGEFGVEEFGQPLFTPNAKK
ncbi:tungstate transport system substrate-binding protein [Clostridium grantii DSM 8605]|uniref:Tungstate transport system substrate-binding protein n=2 Tax=Clostridium TaxID=1485 RepID=A0A1M5WAH0_9CLOT|nr:substrate-binding domain-containing protein [Clostridium grantii]SHH84204.1 tungstate transport system substrate-binding protein [Clostridium grantii DSM 8605]